MNDIFNQMGMESWGDHIVKRLVSAAAVAGMSVGTGDDHPPGVDPGIASGQFLLDAAAHGMGDVAQIQADIDDLCSGPIFKIEQTGVQPVAETLLAVEPHPVAVHGIPFGNNGDITPGKSYLVHFRSSVKKL